MFPTFLRFIFEQKTPAGRAFHWYEGLQESKCEEGQSVTVTFRLSGFFVFLNTQESYSSSKPSQEGR